MHNNIHQQKVTKREMDCSFIAISPEAHINELIIAAYDAYVSDVTMR